MKLCSILSLLILSSVLSGCSNGTAGSGTPPPTTSSSIWVSSWADAPSSYTGGASSELTIREIVKPTVGSRGTVRLHFSNFFGTSPVTLGAVHVGKQTTGAGVTGDIPVTFAGSGSVTIPAGATVLSDNVALNFAYGDVLSVTEYLSGSWPNLTAHA